MSFSLTLTKHTFKYSFFTFHFNSLCDILCLHQLWGLCAEWQHETGTSQMCSLKITKTAVFKKLERCHQPLMANPCFDVPILVNLREREAGHKITEGGRMGRPNRKLTSSDFLRNKWQIMIVLFCFVLWGGGRNGYGFSIHLLTKSSWKIKLFLSRGGGRGEKWPKGKKKRQIPRKMTSLGEGRLEGPWPLRNVHYSSRKANSPGCSGL